MSDAPPYDPDLRRDTPLALKLKERIKREGPISIADYMRACLTDPDHGYYTSRAAIGRDGDFVTAPEIAQVFGELIGLWAVVVWQQMGAPARVNLIELGPGRGTLMKDALRAARLVPQFFDAVSVHLVETNKTLITEQTAALANVPRPLTWHATLDEAPHGPAIIIGNEFLDTIPIRQLVRAAGAWRERGVSLDAAGRLEFLTFRTAAQPNLLITDATDACVAEYVDHSPLLAPLRRLADRAPVGSLFIDYGHAATATGDTLQALHAHRSEHPLTSPGEADLTAHVDFEAFGGEARTARLGVDGPLTQAEFLGRLGIVERASKLMSANPGKAAGIEMGVARLMAVPGMGDRFKAIGVRSAGMPVLPGF